MDNVTPTVGARQALVLACLLSTGLLLAGCQPKSPDASQPLATVNGAVITEKDYEDYLKIRQLQQPPITDKQKEKELVLGEMIDRLLLVQDALNNKLDQELDVYFQIKRQRENVLARAMLRKYLKENPISDDEVKKRYEQEVKKTHQFEYKARHILTKTEDEAKDIIVQLGRGASFAALARQKSVDEQTSKQGGQLPWLNQDVVPEFFNALTTMQKGEISKEPVKTQYGWHVIKLEGSRPAKIPTFEEMKGNIRQFIQREQIDGLVKDLKEKAKIKITE